MKHLCIEKPSPVTKLTSFSCENALPDNADGRIQRAKLISGAPTALSSSCSVQAPVISQASVHWRDRASRQQGNVSMAPPAVESVQSSCLWRIGRAGFFPVLRLDQSSPAKPSGSTMIAGAIPRREARSWSYTGLRHTRLQPQTQQGQRRESWTWPRVQRRKLCDRSASCAKGDRASGEPH